MGLQEELWMGTHVSHRTCLTPKADAQRMILPTLCLRKWQMLWCFTKSNPLNAVNQTNLPFGNRKCYDIAGYALASLEINTTLGLTLCGLALRPHV